jgi:hypothetical protein
MFNKTILMMLLIIVASLVGVSSIYKPANIETQPQPQPTPQGPMSKIIVPPSPLTAQRALEDKQFQIQLVNKLMPEIIKRIDVKLVLTQRPGQIGIAKVVPLIGQQGHAIVKAGCLPGETAVSAGFFVGGKSNVVMADTSVYQVRRDNPNSNVWDIRSTFDSGGGTLKSYAECLKVELSLKQVSAALGQSPLAYLQEIPKLPSQ